MCSTTWTVVLVGCCTGNVAAVKDWDEGPMCRSSLKVGLPFMGVCTLVSLYHLYICSRLANLIANISWHWFGRIDSPPASRDLKEILKANSERRNYSHRNLNGACMHLNYKITKEIWFHKNNFYWFESFPFQHRCIFESQFILWLSCLGDALSLFWWLRQFLLHWGGAECHAWAPDVLR